MQNDLKTKLVASVTGALKNYAENDDLVAGIHLIGYAKNGLLAASTEEDAILLRNLSGPFPQSANFYIFLRKIKTGSFQVDDTAVSKLFHT